MLAYFTHSSSCQDWMSKTEEAQRDIIEIVNDVPTRFSLNGISDATFIGLRGQNRFGDKNKEGGWLKDYAMVLIVPLKKLNGEVLEDRFARPPVNGDTILVDGLDLQVNELESDEFGSALTLFLINANR